MKYTPEERLDIGRKIYHNELTRYEAATKNIDKNVHVLENSLFIVYAFVQASLRLLTSSCTLQRR